jgi:phospholipid/cholesterol/gamma-HCH transport system ATP-binding protein
MIQILNVYKSFGGKPVLDNINLTINKGETLVVIGRSGCGKSVLLKHIIGLLKPDSGKVLISSLDIWALNRKERNQIMLKFGMLFQNSALFDSLTVWENVGFSFLEHTKMHSNEIIKKATEKLKLVDLEDIEYQYPSSLSGGMRKRVGLARAIAMSPEIILYDEPTTGLDPIMADTINSLIVRLKNNLKTTSVAVTHDIKSAYKIADRIAMLYRGRIVQMGTPYEIQNTTNPIVRQFILGEAKGPITEE